MRDEYDALFARAREVAEERGQLYGSRSDPLANVNRAAGFMGHPAWKQALSAAAEALTRLLIVDERGLLTFERAEEWLRDAANFLNFAYLDLRGAANGKEAPQAPEHWTISGDYSQVPIVSPDEDGHDHSHRRNDHAHHARGEAVGRHDGWPNHHHGGYGGGLVFYEADSVAPEYLEGPKADTEVLPEVPPLEEHGYYELHEAWRNDHHHGPDARGGGYVLRVDGEPVAGWPCHQHQGVGFEGESWQHTYADACD